LCCLNLTGETILKRIEPHRLGALVLEDLIERGAVRFEGSNRWLRYRAVS